MSIKNIAFATLVVATAAGAASASSISAGQAQLAKTLGVAGANLSLSELTELNAARNEGDLTAFNHVLENVSSSVDTTATAGNLQRAKVLGVQPGRFTSAELTQLEAAKRSGDDQAWAFVISGENRVSAEKASTQAAAILAAQANRGSDK